MDAYNDVNKMSYGGNNMAIPSRSGAYLALNKVDLSGLEEIRLIASAPKPQLNARGGKVELRLDSPTGPLLGESKFLEPTDKLDFTPNFLTVPVSQPVPSDGKPHDVYLVFVNSKDPLGSMMVVSGVEFVLAGNK